MAAGLAALAPGVARAQRSGPFRVGWLSYVPAPEPALEQFRQGMQELGYVEGKSYVLVSRSADGDFTRLPRLVEELAAERLDVLAARGPSGEYAKPVRDRVPIVFIFSGDPVAAGWAESLRKPGLNMTGITFMALELSAKRIEVLRELLPRASRLALLSNPEHAGELAEYRISEEAALRTGFELTRYVVRTPPDLQRMYREIRAARAEAMIVFPDTLTFTRRQEIARFAAEARIPAMYGWTEYVEAGGLIGYGAHVGEHYKGMARFVDKILKGTSASAIPIEQVSNVRLTINMAAARALGLSVPQTLLARADRLIE